MTAIILFTDLKTQLKYLQEDFRTGISGVQKYGKLNHGPESLKPKQELARFLVKHAVTFTYGPMLSVVFDNTLEGKN